MYNAPVQPVINLSESLQCPVTIRVSNKSITANELYTVKGLLYIHSNL